MFPYKVSNSSYFEVAVATKGQVTDLGKHLGVVNENQPIYYKAGGKKRPVHKAIALANQSEAAINSANQVICT